MVILWPHHSVPMTTCGVRFILESTLRLRYYCQGVHVRVVYYDYATEEQPYCNTNTSCPRLPYHCLT
eukprot:COSAG01_NODE_24339_length_782_cov_3.142020_1_plen_66_part_10